MFKERYSQPLSREKTLEQLFKAPAKLRATLKVWLNKKIEDRDGSERWAERNPGAQRVTVAQCRLMAQAHSHGVSFRALETVFHLRPQSGNSAQRCVWRAQSTVTPGKSSRTKSKAA